MTQRQASPVDDRILLPFVFLLAVWSACAGAAEVNGRVIGVSDGDTLTLMVGTERVKVRLSEIDAPEHGQPYGHRARQSLAELCDREPAIVASAGRDRYGRTVGAVWCRGVLVNREQVRRGYAWVYARYARGDSPLYATQAEARRDHRGLWQATDPTPPWEWRRQRISERNVR